MLPLASLAIAVTRILSHAEVGVAGDVPILLGSLKSGSGSMKGLSSSSS